MLLLHLFPGSSIRQQLRLLSSMGSRSILLVTLLLLSGSTFAQSKPPAESFNSLARRAAEARDANRLDEAVTLYRKALALHPEWPEGWWSLGTLEYDRNHYTSAASAFRRLLPLAPKDGTAYAMLGLCEFELGQDPAALKHIEQAKTLDISSNPQLRTVLLYHDGILLLRAGRFQSAQTVFGGLCQDSVPNDEIVKGLGWAVFRISPKAAPPEATPGGAVIQRAGHAACIAVQKKYDQARKEYAELIAEYPSYPNIHYAFGKFLAESNDVPAAVAEFQQEIKNNPVDINSRLEIAANEYKLDSAAGIPYVEQAIQLNSHIPFAHYLLGLLYLDTDDCQKAIPQLEIAQKSFPKDAKIYFALGSAYARVGRKQDAEKARTTFQRLSRQTAEGSNASY